MENQPSEYSYSTIIDGQMTDVYTSRAGVEYIVECGRATHWRGVRFYAETIRELKTGTLRVIQEMNGEHVKTTTPAIQTVERCKEIARAFTSTKRAVLEREVLA